MNLSKHAAPIRAFDHNSEPKNDWPVRSSPSRESKSDFTRLHAAPRHPKKEYGSQQVEESVGTGVLLSCNHGRPKISGHRADYCTRIKRSQLLERCWWRRRESNPRPKMLLVKRTTCLVEFMPQALPWDVRGLRSEPTRNAFR